MKMLCPITVSKSDEIKTNIEYTRNSSMLSIDLKNNIRSSSEKKIHLLEKFANTFYVFNILNIAFVLSRIKYFPSKSNKNNNDYVTIILVFMR